ncbi:MAG: hypothetical protein U0903_16125 [Planctomycetales bacterium]
MKVRVAITAAVLGVLVGSLGLEGQIKKGKSRPLQTKQLMQGLVFPNCGALGKGLKTPPTDDKGWDSLAMHAALLNEASYILMDDGRCPDKDWADAVKQLREGSKEVLAAVEAKNAEKASAAMKTMTGSCGACHSKHKK